MDYIFKIKIGQDKNRRTCSSNFLSVTVTVTVERRAETTSEMGVYAWCIWCMYLAYLFLAVSAFAEWPLARCPPPVLLFKVGGAEPASLCRECTKGRGAGVTVTATLFTFDMPASVFTPTNREIKTLSFTRCRLHLQDGEPERAHCVALDTCPCSLRYMLPLGSYA